MSNKTPIGNGQQAKSRRLAAIAALVLLALAVAALAINSIRALHAWPSHGGAGDAGLRHGLGGIAPAGPRRPALMVLAGLLLVGAIAVLLTGRILAETFAAVGLFMLSTVAQRAEPSGCASRFPHRPTRAVMIWNPRSGRGQAAAAHLDAEARARGIEPIELRPGDDLQELVRDRSRCRRNCRRGR